jgi:hypothetical protein
MKIFTIASPAPQSVLKTELAELFPNRIISEAPNSEGMEVCIMFDLNEMDIVMIENEIGTVLIASNNYNPKF